MRKIIFLITLFLLTSCKNQDYSDFIYKSESRIVFKKGDDKKWLEKDYDDSDWKKEWEFEFEMDGEIFITRKTITLKKSADTFAPFGVVLQTMGAYELYWDGVLIGVNGKPGKEKGNPKEGSFLRTYLIPNELATKGEHVIATRSSKYYKEEQHLYSYAHIDEYHKLIEEPLKRVLYVHILAGIFLIASIYYFFLYVNDKKNYTLLLFGLACFLFFLLIIMEYIKFYVPFHYSYFFTRLKIIGFLTLLISFLIPYYFTIQFPFKHYKLVAIFYLIILIFIYLFYSKSYDYTALTLSQTMWIASMLIISYAIYKKEKGSIIIFFGLILSFIVYQLSIYDVSLFVSFTIILLCMFYISSIKIKEQRLAFEQSIAQSTRLKYELLKKKIQPHFLMNTLTSLIDWVEEAPNKGVEFIEALAEEFDLLNQVENEKLIPISQEIKLCKSHINIMKYRKEIDYIWEDEGVDDTDNQNIPPAVIHTLLENGITHCLPLENNKMLFKLNVKSSEDKLIYDFTTHGKVRLKTKKSTGGTGFKYIKARLKESYGDNWEFTSNETENGWKNTITIYT